MTKMTLQQEIDQVFEHLCCYDRSEWDELVAAIQAQALRDAAGDAGAHLGDATSGHTSTYSVRRWLTRRADQIEKEAGR